MTKRIIGFRMMRLLDMMPLTSPMSDGNRGQWAVICDSILHPRLLNQVRISAWVMAIGSPYIKMMILIPLITFSSSIILPFRRPRSGLRPLLPQKRQNFPGNMQTTGLLQM